MIDIETPADWWYRLAYPLQLAVIEISRRVPSVVAKGGEGIAGSTVQPVGTVLVLVHPVVLILRFYLFEDGVIGAETLVVSAIVRANANILPVV